MFLTNVTLQKNQHDAVTGEEKRGGGQNYASRKKRGLRKSTNAATASENSKLKFTAVTKKDGGTDRNRGLGLPEERVRENSSPEENPLRRAIDVGELTEGPT